MAIWSPTQTATQNEVVAPTRLFVGPSEENKSALLEKRLEASEAALAHSKQDAGVLGQLLKIAKASIESLGREADSECQSLQNELGSKRAKLETALRKNAPNGYPKGCDSERSEELLLEVRKLQSETTGLRTSEENSWTQLVAVNEAGAAGVIRLQEDTEQRVESWTKAAREHMSVEGREYVGRSDAFRNSVGCHVANLEAVTEESAASIRAACDLKTRDVNTKIIDTKLACEDAERRLGAAEQGQEALKAKLSGARGEIASAELGQSESEASVREHFAKCGHARQATRDLDEEVQTRTWEASELGSGQDSAEEALHGIEKQLERADDLFFRELEVELEGHARNLRAACERSIHNEAIAASAVLVAEKSQADRLNVLRSECKDSEATLRVAMDAVPSGTDVSWAKLLLRAGRDDEKKKMRRCSASWASGSHRARARTTAACANLRLHANGPRIDLGDHCEQGEQRVASLEQLNAKQAERATSGVRAAAAELRQVQVGWDMQLRQLRREFEEEVSLTQNSEASKQKSAAEAAVWSDQLKSGEEAIAAARVQRQPIGFQLTSPTNESTSNNRKLETEVAQLRHEVASAEEAIGMLVAGPSALGDGGSGASA